MRKTAFLILILTGLTVILSGCATPSVHDEPTRLGLQELLDSEEFTQEERDAVHSIKVHDDKCWVQLVEGFTNDSDVIFAVSKHIAYEFAIRFKEKAWEHDFTVPKYYVYILLDYKTDKGTNKARPATAYWDSLIDQVEIETQGLGDTSREIH